MLGKRTIIAAYLLILVLAAAGLYEAQRATSLAREVDNRGDIRSCRQDNFIRNESNRRDDALAATARLTVKALATIASAERLPGDPTNRRLRKIIREASKVPVDFKRQPPRNCLKEFPKP